MMPNIAIPTGGRVGGLLLVTVLLAGFAVGGDAAVSGTEMNFDERMSAEVIEDGRFVEEQHSEQPVPDLIHTPRLDAALERYVAVPITQTAIAVGGVGYDIGYAVGVTAGMWAVQGVMYLAHAAVIAYAGVVALRVIRR